MHGQDVCDLYVLYSGLMALRRFSYCPGRRWYEWGSASSMLHAGRSLIKLDLKDNSLGEEAGCALAYVLQAHPNLRHLNLSETGARTCDAPCARQYKVKFDTAESLVIWYEKFDASSSESFARTATKSILVFVGALFWVASLGYAAVCF